MTSGELIDERLETLLLARLSTLKRPPAVEALASALHRHAPATLNAAAWRDRAAACLNSLVSHGAVDAELHLRRTDELKRRTGVGAVKGWQQWTDRILPGLALGVRADDVRAHERLDGCDAWAAAIVARAHGLWTKGPPPTVSKVCDALTWHALGLASQPKQCPPEVRAYFLRSYIELDATRPERMLRQLAAKLTGAPRADLKALCLALTQAWLTGRDLEAQAIAEPASAPRREPELSAMAQAPSLIDAVRSAARDARDGVFGDRKVFISSVWHALRATPSWSQLELDDFKARLVSAHRQRQLELARADFVGAMDPALVVASETATDGTTFHFIIREPLQ